MVGAVDYGALDADPSAHLVAKVSELDSPVGSLEDGSKARLLVAARLMGVATQGRVRDVVRAIGRALEPEFHEDQWWV